MADNIYIYGEIGVETTLQGVVNQLSNVTQDEIIVNIASQGGEVYEGYAIYNLLKSRTEKVTTNIQGMCGSIATLIALAGDKVLMAKDVSEFFIHNPFSRLMGDAKQFKKAAEDLSRIQNTVLKVYKDKTGLDEAEIMSMMDNETGMSYDQAKEKGFVDGEIEQLKAVAQINLNNYKMEKEEAKALETRFDKLMMKLDNFISKKPKMMITTLANDEQIYIAADNIKEAAGKSIKKADNGEATGEDVPDGVYKIKDSELMIKVASGMVEEVTEVEDEREKEINALKTQLAEKEATEKEMSAKYKEAMLMLKEASDNIKELKNKIPMGDDTPPAHRPKVSAEAKTSLLGDGFVDLFYNEFKRQIK